MFVNLKFFRNNLLNVLFDDDNFLFQNQKCCAISETLDSMLAKVSGYSYAFASLTESTSPCEVSLRANATSNVLLDDHFCRLINFSDNLHNI